MTEAAEPALDPDLDAGHGAAVTATFCATLVDEWVRAGITDAVVAPGSRSTPMALALAARPELSVHVHHDERSAGFVALGLGLSSNRPALVLTTSGTAAVELHPAVVEAHQAGVPLIAITADRPPELHHVGAPQTVDQQHLFGRAVRWFVDPGVPDAGARSTWRSLAARTVAEATDGPVGPGPVHLNLPFREPLIGVPSDLPRGRPDGAGWHIPGDTRAMLPARRPELLEQLLAHERGVIVAGVGAGDPVAVLALARATGWPVLADPRSGCRLLVPSVIACADAILRHEPVAMSLVPEAVLRIGAPPASKVVARWLAVSGAMQVAVDAHGRWFDADHSAVSVLQADPTTLIDTMVELAEIEPDVRARRSDWSDRWSRAEASAQLAIDDALDGHGELTEPGVARTLASSLPDGSTLVVSSSMPVRDLEWYGRPRSGLRVVANRGANGIDGVVSTALGVALAAKGSGGTTAVLVGDVALLHDSNALIGIAERGVDLTIVVVDNDGGGIFSFLPQAGSLDPGRFEALFGTPHGVDLRVLVAAHGLVTVEPSGSADLGSAILASTSARGVHLVLVRTNRSDNVDVHDELHAAVADALRDLV